ncbi:histidine ABC transporter substrate-binding protein [Agrobacterium vitis]|uniref:ABC transporter substrate-binding protein n=1 Tax=Agrobacterium vitis TaxID=373 RepID=UPI0012E8C47F|nr:ABC transporter substrate-binding protein [Agrobacterium vitis]MVA22067.1 histidine ABC transporter substrate-binding protein [Agrobacterium vitis]
MKMLKTSLLVSGFMLCASAGMASATSYCESGNTVKFAGIDWESGSFITEVMKTILSKGYGCTVESIPGTSVVLEHATVTNDIQIFAEQWVGRSDVWNEGIAKGTVLNVGKPFVGASEGWFVPDYVVHGDEARGIKPVAPDLKSVSQLKDPEIKALFADPEEPAKGRFLNCPSGWSCETISTAKLQAYHLDNDYTNFRPGTGTALDAAIASAYTQGEPILFYYWSPTAVMGKYKLLQLEEPAYSDACWKELSSVNGKREQGCAFPSVTVTYGVNAEFAKAAPEIIAVLEKATMPLSDVNGTLAYMADNQLDGAAAATYFLKTKSDEWGKWVSPDAKAKIEATLK